MAEDFNLISVLHHGVEQAGAAHVLDLYATAAILKWSETDDFKNWLEELWILKPELTDKRMAVAMLIRYRMTGRIR